MCWSECTRCGGGGGEGEELWEEVEGLFGCVPRETAVDDIQAPLKDVCELCGPPAVIDVEGELDMALK